MHSTDQAATCLDAMVKYERSVPDHYLCRRPQLPGSPRSAKVAFTELREYAWTTGKLVANEAIEFNLKALETSRGKLVTGQLYRECKVAA